MIYLFFLTIHRIMTMHYAIDYMIRENNWRQRLKGRHSPTFRQGNTLSGSVTVFSTFLWKQAPGTFHSFVDNLVLPLFRLTRASSFFYPRRSQSPSLNSALFHPDPPCFTNPFCHRLVVFYNPLTSQTLCLFSGFQFIAYLCVLLCVCDVVQQAID